MKRIVRNKLAFLIATAVIAGTSFAAHAQWFETPADPGYPGYLKSFDTQKLAKTTERDTGHTATREDYAKYYQEMFDLLDRNHDGVLDESEWPAPHAAK